MIRTVSEHSALLSVIVVTMSITAGAFGQVSLTPDRRPFMTSNQVIAVDQIKRLPRLCRRR